MYKNKTDNIISGIFCLIICICLVLILKNVYQYRSADSEYKKLKNVMTEKSGRIIIEADEDTVSENNNNNIVKETDFEKLYRINHDLVCILSIPSLDLTYPVVQSADNVRYISRTFEGNKNPAGCLFLDYENKKDLSDPDIYIYGHNMKNGSMFGSLKKLREEGYRQSAAFLTTDTGTKQYSLLKTEVVDIDSYSAPKDQTGLLTLYTCWGNDKTKRLLVTFKEEEGYRQFTEL